MSLLSSNETDFLLEAMVAVADEGIDVVSKLVRLLTLGSEPV